MYITLKQFAESNRWPSLAALRSIYHQARHGKNRFLSAFSTSGRRVLIDPDKFFKLVETQNSKPIGAV